jgi:hypothetical protein
MSEESRILTIENFLNNILILQNESVKLKTQLGKIGYYKIVKF